MSKKSFFDKITGKKEAVAESGPVIEDGAAGEEHAPQEGEVDHLWMKEDLDAKKPKLEKDPRIDTGILRDRIADKLSKMNNH